METLQKTVSDNLKTLMKATGYNQSKVAELLGVSPSTVNHWLHEKRKIDLEDLTRLGEVFGIDPQELLTGGELIASPPEPPKPRKPRLREAIKVVNEHVGDLVIKVKSKKKS